MKNNKSAGIDDVTSELIKFGPLNEISKRIASLFNHIAEHGDPSEEIHKGYYWFPFKSLENQQNPVQI